MTADAARPVKETVWIALSAQGGPAPFIGYAYLRKELARNYEKTYGHTLKQAGYRLVKVRLTNWTKGKP
jgi:hypothetical protein